MSKHNIFVYANAFHTAALLITAQFKTHLRKASLSPWLEHGLLLCDEYKNYYSIVYLTPEDEIVDSLKFANNQQIEINHLSLLITMQ